MRAYMRLIQDATQYLNAGDYADTEQVALPVGFEWAEGVPPDTSKPYIPFNPLKLLEQLISQGQQAMLANPLPTDLQKQIFDMEVFIQNYYQRGAFGLIVSSIQAFVIPADRTDVTPAHRAIVSRLKAQMLEAFHAL
jgi:hypothetical protein